MTIDDAFTSFYKNAWPYLKKNKIPFILFVSTEPVGKKGYMTWEQIYEVEKEPYAFIGNHSHSHEYLVEESFNIFKEDIDRSISIFKEKLGYNPEFFSYPFGEYSLKQKKYIQVLFVVYHILQVPYAKQFYHALVQIYKFVMLIFLDYILY